MSTMLDNYTEDAVPEGWKESFNPPEEGWKWVLIGRAMISVDLYPWDVHGSGEEMGWGYGVCSVYDNSIHPNPHTFQTEEQALKWALDFMGDHPGGPVRDDYGEEWRVEVAKNSSPNYYRNADDEEVYG